MTLCAIALLREGTPGYPYRTMVRQAGRGVAREAFPCMANESYDALLTSWSGFPGVVTIPRQLPISL